MLDVYRLWWSWLRKLRIPKKKTCWFHRWGTRPFHGTGPWIPRVPDAVIGGSPPEFKECGKCGTKKRLRWR